MKEMRPLTPSCGAGVGSQALRPADHGGTRRLELTHDRASLLTCLPAGMPSTKQACFLNTNEVQVWPEVEAFQVKGSIPPPPPHLPSHHNHCLLSSCYVSGFVLSSIGQLMQLILATA